MPTNNWVFGALDFPLTSQGKVRGKVREVLINQWLGLSPEIHPLEGRRSGKSPPYAGGEKKKGVEPPLSSLTRRAFGLWPGKSQGKVRGKSGESPITPYFIGFLGQGKVRGKSEMSNDGADTMEQPVSLAPGDVLRMAIEAGVLPSPRRPLAVGVGPLALDRMVDRLGVSKTAARRAFALYVRCVAYWSVCVVGAARVDLDGVECGVVSEREADWARRQLMEHDAAIAGRVQERLVAKANRKRTQAMKASVAPTHGGLPRLGLPRGEWRGPPVGGAR